MPVFEYQTIAKPSTGLYKEKGSKFLAFAYPVASENEVKDRLALLKKEYYDARHHCYAWVLHPDHSKFRAADDGEPNHSAGDPILGQIRSHNLTFILIVVVRYFGGVKLGVGGLVQAYKAAAEDALLHAEIVRRDVMVDVKITYTYNDTSAVMRLVKEFDLHIIDQQFGASCSLRAEVKLEKQQKLTEQLSLLAATGASVQFD